MAVANAYRRNFPAVNSSPVAPSIYKQKLVGGKPFGNRHTYQDYAIVKIIKFFQNVVAQGEIIGAFTVLQEATVDNIPRQ